MDDLIAQFNLLSDQALRDKSFDPTAIEDLMKLFEMEAYESWSAMEVACAQEVEEAHNSLREAEDYLESEMERAMEEFRVFEKEMERDSAAELSGLVRRGDAARKLGGTMEKAAGAASSKYVEAATSAAVGTARSAWKGFSTSSQKVHPS